MREFFKSRRLKSLLPYFLLALAVIGAYKIINEFHVLFQFFERICRIITPFFYGFLLAYILNIPCTAIQKLLDKVNNNFICKRKKALGVLLVYLLFVLILLVILNLIVPSVYESISTFGANFQTYYQGARQMIDYINGMDIIGINISLDEIVVKIREFGMEILPSSLGMLSGVPSAILRSFLAFISSIYILLEKEKFKAFISRVIKALTSCEVYDVIAKYTGKINHNFKQYIYTQTIDGCILGTIATIELALLRSPFALTLGIMLGVVNYIPYFGSIIGSLIAVVIVAFTQGMSSALLTAVILLITQQIDGNVIQPKLMGGSFSLSPLLVIFSITVGGAFAGVLGMIAAIPIVAVGKDLFEDLIIWFEHRKTKEKA